MSLMAGDQWIWAGPPLPTTVSGFIQQKTRLGQLGQTLDFTMDYVARLCETEPENCAWLLESLMETDDDHLSENHNLSFQNEVYSDIIKDNNDQNYELIDRIKESDLKTFLGLPRHTLMLALIPFFPAMLLFTASGGLAFFVTAGIEFLSRLV